MKIKSLIYRWIIKNQKKYQESKSRPRIVFLDDIITASFFIEKNYELEELEKMKFIIEKYLTNSYSMSFLDIGANIGNHTLFLNHYFSKTYCFEPNPEVFDVLVLNTKRESSIHPFNFGLSDTTKDVELSFDSINCGGGSIENRNHNNVNVVKIKLKRLDEVVNSCEFGNIGMLKIDVEGHELEVIKGGIETIAESNCIIFFEVLSQDSDKFKEVEELLKKIGYGLFEVRKKWKPTKIFSDHWSIKELIYDSKKDYPLILAMPEKLCL
jgi:FkbM family methyltransferase